MTDELLAYSIAKMKEYGIVDSGDSLKLGIGAMTDARMEELLRQDGARRRGQAGPRLQACLHAAVRQQEASASDLRPKNDNIGYSAGTADARVRPRGVFPP